MHHSHPRNLNHHPINPIIDPATLNLGFSSLHSKPLPHSLIDFPVLNPDSPLFTSQTTHYFPQRPSSLTPLNPHHSFYRPITYPTNPLWLTPQTPSVRFLLTRPRLLIAHPGDPASVTTTDYPLPSPLTPSLMHKPVTHSAHPVLRDPREAPSLTLQSPIIEYGIQVTTPP